MPEPRSQTVELMRAAQSGDNVALGRLLQRYSPLVLKIVRLRMGKLLRRRMESGDILQDAFGKAIQRFEHFEMRNAGSMINWLCRLAENTIHEAVDRETAQKRDVRRELEQAPESSATGNPAVAMAAPVTHILDRLVREEDEQTLLDCVEQLPVHHLEIIVLRNYDRLSFEEIRVRTGRASEGAARVAHAKALRRLEQLVAARRRERPSQV